MTSDPLLIEQTADGVVSVVLNRPDMHNALDETLLRSLTRSFDMLGGDSSVRAVVLKANGQSFCAGADIGWLQRISRYTPEQHLEEAANLALMLKAVYDFPRPLIGMVQGAAAGVGMGLIACCDIVVASDASSFRMSEIKLGFAPAIISPYVVRAMGGRAAQRYILTAEPFSATDAKNNGLIHEIVPERMMQAAAAKLIERLTQGGPKAQMATKAMIRRLEQTRIDDEVMTYGIDLVARQSSSPEGKEGLAAFLEKRNPNWPKR